MSQDDIRSTSAQFIASIGEKCLYQYNLHLSIFSPSHRVGIFIYRASIKSAYTLRIRPVVELANDYPVVAIHVLGMDFDKTVLVVSACGFQHDADQLGRFVDIEVAELVL